MLAWKLATSCAILLAPFVNSLTIKSSPDIRTPITDSVSCFSDTGKADDSILQQDRQINGFLFLFLWISLRPTIYLCQNLQFIKNKARDSNNLTGRENSRIQANGLLLEPWFHDELSALCHRGERTRSGQPSPGPTEQVHCPYLRTWFPPTFFSPAKGCSALRQLEFNMQIQRLISGAKQLPPVLHEYKCATPHGSGN